MTVNDQKRQKRLSINSSVGVLSLHNVRPPEAKWPSVLGVDDGVREISMTEKCDVLGNKSWRNAVLLRESEGVDTAWMPTPVTARKEIIGELTGGFFTRLIFSLWKKEILTPMYTVPNTIQMEKQNRTLKIYINTGPK